MVHSDTLFSVPDTDVRVAHLNDLGLYVARIVVDPVASEGLAGGALPDGAGLSAVGAVGDHRPVWR